MQHEINLAVKILKAGGLVAFPTETVYGLGADASNPEAVSKIFATKERPADHPLIVHLADIAQVPVWAHEFPVEAQKLAAAFWPGPLTLILKRSSLVPDVVTATQDTVGIRIPSHPLALALLRAFGQGVAAPSANRFGRISPTSAVHVAEELGDRVDLILDGGNCQVGLESTIVDCSSAKARVLRPGGISLPAISAVLGYEVGWKQRSGIRVSGTLESHYAPSTPVQIVESSKLASLEGSSLESDSLGLLCHSAVPTGFAAVSLQLPAEPADYAQQLYAALRELDKHGLERIIIEAVPETDAWLAVRDRLRRASSSVRTQEVASLAASRK